MKISIATLFQDSKHAGFLNRSSEWWAFLLIAFFSMPGFVKADAGRIAPGSNPSISEFLNPDGTLNLSTGFYGSLNLTGFRVYLHAQKGIMASPALQKETMIDDWSAMGSGLDGSCNAIAVSGTDVYAGGYFTTAGGVSASRIAKWDGSTWSALGSGLDDGCFAIAVSGTDVYAGGFFTTAGGVSASRIAKWDGSSWSALGNGLSNYCTSIAVSGTDVYAGGVFTMAGGISANRIARWNGSSWSALGSGLNGNCYAVAVSGTDVYAGGEFSMAGGVSASRIARWNGSSWSALGSGLVGNCVAVAVSGTDVYVGGFLFSAGGVPVNHIARWNGSSWSALGTGFDNYSNVIVVSGTDVYAGGAFTGNAAKWDGHSWLTLGSGLNGECIAMGTSGTDVYAGGAFTMDNYIARWGAVALPVELSDFSGRIQGKSILLNWETASETRNKGFDVERSTDGWDWTRLDFVPALSEGNGLQVYAFTDEKPLPGRNYYRLKQWDIDGKYEYSKVISVELADREGQVGAFYPSPMHSGLVSLDYETGKEADLHLSVFDLAGRLMLHRTQPLEAGRNVLHFDFSELPSGIYSVRLDDGTNRTVRTVTIK